MDDKLQQARSRLTNCVGEKSDKKGVMTIVHEILDNSSALHDRYFCVDCVKLLRDNCRNHSLQEVSAVIEALRILEKYGKNLLRSDRPSYWRIVRLSNPYFHDKVDNIQGSRLILKQLGYSIEIHDGLAFPESVRVPDTQAVQLVTSDIILLKYELAMFLNNQHPSPQSISHYIQIRDYRGSIASISSLKSTDEDKPCTSRSITSQNSRIESQNSVPTTTACVVCGQKLSDFYCPSCQKQLCASCDEKWHLNRDRQGHKRLPMQSSKPNNVTLISEKTVIRTNADQLSLISGLIQPSVNPFSLGEGDSQTMITTTSVAFNHNFKPSMSAQAFNPVPSRERFETDKNNYSSAKPVPAFTSTKYMVEPNLNWEERFDMIKVQLSKIMDISEKQRIVEKFCKDVDEQVKKFTDEANGLNHLVFVQQHFQQRGQELLQKKFELIEHVSVNAPPSSQVPWDALPTSTQLKNSTHVQPPKDTSTIYGEASVFTQEIRHPPKFEKIPAPSVPLLSSGTVHQRQAVETSVQYPLGPTRDVDISSVLTYNQDPSRSKITPGPTKTPPRHTSPTGTCIDSEISSHTFTGTFFDKTSSNHTFSTGTFVNNPSNIGSGHTFPTRPMVDNTLSFVSTAMFPKKSTAYESIALKKESYRLACLKTVDKLREAEDKKINLAEIKVALSEIQKSSNANASVQTWLSNNNLKDLFKPLLETYPSISYAEACNLFHENDGDIALTQKAIQLQHAYKVKLLTQQSKCSENEAISCLNKNNGDCLGTLIELQKPLLQGFIERFQNRTKLSFKVKDFSNAKDPSHLKNTLLAVLPIKEIVVVDMMSSVLFKCFENHDSESELFSAMLDYDISDVYEAAKSFPDSIDSALKYLENTCNLCLDMFSQNNLKCMTACGDNGCTYCCECLGKFLAFHIKEGHIRDLVCPVCKLPDIDHDDEAATTHFSYLDGFIKRYLDEQTYAVYQKKLTDQALMKMANFRWCSHCENGFVYDEIDENNPKMVCSACHKATCYKCKKRWEIQHEGISCQAFLEWKRSNDEEFQSEGLAAHLKENGIDCPSCNFRYDLAKGGCMHFKCLMCSFQFCSGCNSPFRQGQICSVFRDCFSRGLHAHHPRDCLFYLRDLEIERLQRILSDAGLAYDTEPLHHHSICQVFEQKEASEGLSDEICGRQVNENNADLCELHYKEYLVNLINDNRLDPANVFTITELEICLQRSYISRPIKDQYRTEQEYRNSLLVAVKILPLIHQRQSNGEKLRNVNNIADGFSRNFFER